MPLVTQWVVWFTEWYGDRREEENSFHPETSKPRKCLFLALVKPPPTALAFCRTLLLETFFIGTVRKHAHILLLLRTLFGIYCSCSAVCLILIGWRRNANDGRQSRFGMQTTRFGFKHCCRPLSSSLKPWKKRLGLITSDRWMLGLITSDLPQTPPHPPLHIEICHHRREPSIYITSGLWLLHKPTFLIQLAAGTEIINTFEPDFVDFLSEKSPNSVKIQAYRPESVSKQGIRIIEAVKP